MRLVVLAVLVTLSAATPALADQNTYAPLDRPGPPLSVPAALLHAALGCTAGFAAGARDPILLVPGTNLDPASNYSWNYERALAALRWPYCTITLPYHTMGDIQVAGEYIVYALRTIAAVAHRQVDILGYSQGGMLPRWALRFWPDTRSLVHSFVAIDPSNHGTVVANAACQRQCAPADWQQAQDAHFIAALNSRAETFSGIDYTVIFSRADEIVVPNFDTSGSSSLHTGTGRIVNIAVQQICPADVSDHLAMGSYDPVAYALAIDAFAHEGLADPARISASVCASPFQPGVDPASFPADYASYLQAIGQAEAEAPQVTSEPPLRCYVFASCQVVSAGRSHRAAHPHRRMHRRRTHHHRARRGKHRRREAHHRRDAHHRRQAHHRGRRSTRQAPA